MGLPRATFIGFLMFCAKSLSFRVVNISIIFGLGELLGLSLQSGACFSGSDTSRKTFFSYDCSNCMVFYSRIKRTCSNCMVFYSRIERATNTAPRNARRASVAFCRPGRLPGELKRFRPPTSYLRRPTSHSLFPTSSFLLPSSDFLLPTSCFPLPASLLPSSCFPLPASPQGWPVFRRRRHQSGHPMVPCLD